MTLEEALKKIALLEGVTKELDDKLTEFKSMDIEALQGKVQSYEALGTVEEVEELITTAESMKEELGKYRDLGEVQELEDALESMVTFSENFHSKLGANIEEVESALSTAKETIEAYSELGTIADIEELIDTAKDLNESLNEYRELLTVDEALAVVESYEQDLHDIQVNDLMESFSITAEFAGEMIEKWGSKDEAEKALSQVTSSLKTTVENQDATDNKEGEGKPEETEKTEESTTVATPAKSRLRNLLGL